MTEPSDSIEEITPNVDEAMAAIIMKEVNARIVSEYLTEISGIAQRYGGGVYKWVPLEDSDGKIQKVRFSLVFSTNTDLFEELGQYPEYINPQISDVMPISDMTNAAMLSVLLNKAGVINHAVDAEDKSNPRLSSHICYNNVTLSMAQISDGLMKLKAFRNDSPGYF